MRVAPEQLRKTAQSEDPVLSVVHLATLEVACHAGGRGFESRRSRFKNGSVRNLRRCCVLGQDPAREVVGSAPASGE
jgi:hypothetical protein